MGDLKHCFQAPPETASIRIRGSWLKSLHDGCLGASGICNLQLTRINAQLATTTNNGRFHCLESPWTHGLGASPPD